MQYSPWEANAIYFMDEVGPSTARQSWVTDHPSFYENPSPSGHHQGLKEPKTTTSEFYTIVLGNKKRSLGGNKRKSPSLPTPLSLSPFTSLTHKTPFFDCNCESAKTTSLPPQAVWEQFLSVTVKTILTSHLEVTGRG